MLVEMWLVAFLFHKIRPIVHLFSFYLVHFRLLRRLSYIFLKPLFSAVKQNSSLWTGVPRTTNTLKCKMQFGLEITM